MLWITLKKSYFYFIPFFLFFLKTRYNIIFWVEKNGLFFYTRKNLYVIIVLNTEKYFFKYTKRERVLYVCVYHVIDDGLFVRDKISMSM